MILSLERTLSQGLFLTTMVMLLSIPFLSGCFESDFGGGFGKGSGTPDYGPAYLSADSAISLGTDSMSLHGHIAPYFINTEINISEVGITSSGRGPTKSYPLIKNVKWKFSKLDTSIHLTAKVKKIEDDGKIWLFNVYVVVNQPEGRKRYSGLSLKIN